MKHFIGLFIIGLLVSPGAVTGTELAGNPLAAYPYFEYVRAINADAAVYAAIDPTRYPQVVGVTAHLYLVSARTGAQWDSDPSLSDVRPRGPDTVFLGGSTVQENTFELASGGELDADAGTGLGLGYDVVLDLDRDGLLDSGDLIDGRGDESGFYAVHDLTQTGPLPTASTTYSGGAWLGQKTWYPSGIAGMGQLPLVVISHGNGHDYTWYDYLQEHLASYGYVVMSHENNTQPGIETASTTTLNNTDYFLGHLDVIGGGIFAGHIDGSRITWIGHSRGGEGVCRAYDRLYDDDYIPDHYELHDVVLVSSISPNDYLGRHQSDPHQVIFHLLQGAADGDNTGWPDRESDAPFHVYERAGGTRQMTHIHGADHNDFNCCGWNDFTGPPGTEIGRAEAQRVARATYLALLKHHIEGNLPALDYLWRQYEALKPIGVNAATVVEHEYREGPGAGVFVIDDFQSEPSLDTSSSGGSVSMTVLNAWEGQQDDTDGTFTWSTSDPMNGMARGRTDDLAACLVFDWGIGGSRQLEFELLPAAENLLSREYLSFRACQGTRHPDTVVELGDLTFTVTLRDGNGASSSIGIGAYGGGVEEPYQRTGSGTGAGWQTEFETIRIRLTDFLANGSGLDLSRVAALVFEFGTPFGSNRGRIGLDDLQFTGIQAEADTIAAEFSCSPSSGTVPFSTVMTATLDNLYTGQTRQIAGRINVSLAGGSYFGGWRAGFTNVAAGGSFGSTWAQAIPALGSVIGTNTFELLAEDVTPAPFNQPPYPPAGDQVTDTCSLVANAP